MYIPINILFLMTDSIIVDDEYIVAGLENRTIKLCPHCGGYGELASGCNYIKCPVKECGKEWCFQCGLSKGNGVNECNDKTHNSH